MLWALHHFIYHLVLESTLSQSHLPRENAAHFLQLKPLTQCQCSFHLIPISAGWTETVWIQSLPKDFTHDQRRRNRTQTPWSQVQSLNHSATLSTSHICLLILQAYSLQAIWLIQYSLWSSYDQSALPFRINVMTSQTIYQLFILVNDCSAKDSLHTYFPW